MIAPMPRRAAWLLLALVLFAAWTWWRQPAPEAVPDTPGTPPAAVTRAPDVATRTPDVAAATIPREAFDTLRLIERGGPYPHRQDDGVFGNREGLLPPRPRGWYREYTVRTPGERDRGARRIVTGGAPPTEFFYTADHYRSFRRFDPDSGQLR